LPGAVTFRGGVELLDGRFERRRINALGRGHCAVEQVVAFPVQVLGFRRKAAGDKLVVLRLVGGGGRRCAIASGRIKQPAAKKNDDPNKSRPANDVWDRAGAFLSRPPPRGVSGSAGGGVSGGAHLLSCRGWFAGSITHAALRGSQNPENLIAP